MNINNLTKKVASVALGTTILFASVSGASAASYTVKSGDTLTSIAKKYNTNYSAIMTENGLKSTTIRIGQKLQIGEKVSTSTSAKAKSPTSTAKTTYTVKKGDTLSSIAKKYGIKYTAIMSSNNLKTTAIKVGQKLTISSTIAATAKASTPAKKAATVATVTNGTDIKTVAEKYLGTPYVFGGYSPAGFDCSGFVYYVLKNSGKSLSRTNAAGFYQMAKKVSTPQVGDLVFFSNTYKKGVSHVGIYIGSGKMISASGKKVNVSTIHSGYWKSYFTGYGRV